MKKFCLCVSTVTADNLKKDLSEFKNIKVQSLWSFLVQFGLKWDNEVKDDEFGVTQLQELPPDKSANIYLNF